MTVIQKRRQIKSLLTYKEEQVVSMRFGLNGFKPATLEKVGIVFDCTREHVRQIEAKALRKLNIPQMLNVTWEQYREEVERSITNGR